MTSSSVAEKGNAHVEQASTTTATTVSISAQTELTALGQAPESQIAKWRLVSLYVRYVHRHALLSTVDC